MTHEPEHDSFATAPFTYWPDGYTERDIDELTDWVYAQADQAEQPTSALIDGSAAKRRDRRITRRSFGHVVRSLPAWPTPGQGDQAA